MTVAGIRRRAERWWRFAQNCFTFHYFSLFLPLFSYLFLFFFIPFFFSFSSPFFSSFFSLSSSFLSQLLFLFSHFLFPKWRLSEFLQRNCEIRYLFTAYTNTHKHINRAPINDLSGQNMNVELMVTIAQKLHAGKGNDKVFHHFRKSSSSLYANQIRCVIDGRLKGVETYSDLYSRSIYTAQEKKRQTLSVHFGALTHTLMIRCTCAFFWLRIDFSSIFYTNLTKHMDNFSLFLINYTKLHFFAPFH